MGKKLNELSEAKLFAKLHKLRFEILDLVNQRNLRSSAVGKSRIQNRINLKHNTYQKVDAQLQVIIDERIRREATEGTAIKIADAPEQA